MDIRPVDRGDSLRDAGGRARGLSGAWGVQVQNFGFPMATACRKNAPTGGKTMFYADTAEAAQCAAFRSSQPRPGGCMGSAAAARLLQVEILDRLLHICV